MHRRFLREPQITCLLEGLNLHMFAINCADSKWVLPFFSKLAGFLSPTFIGLGKFDAFVAELLPDCCADLRNYFAESWPRNAKDVFKYRKRCRTTEVPECNLKTKSCWNGLPHLGILLGDAMLQPTKNRSFLKEEKCNFEIF